MNEIFKDNLYKKIKENSDSIYLHKDFKNRPDSDQRKHFDFIEKDISTETKLIIQWMENTCFVIEKLLSEENKENFWIWEGLFWIRIYAVIVEMIPYFCNETIKQIVDRIKNSPCQESTKKLAISREMLCNKLNKMKSLLIEDELILIDYLRNTHCHMRQTAYHFIDLKQGLRMKTPKIKTLGKEFKAKEIDLKLKTIMKKYSANQFKIARDIALKIQPIMQEIWICVSNRF